MLTPIRNGSILVLVSHDMDLLKEYCDEGVVIRDGAVTDPMPVGEAIDIHLKGTATPPEAPR